MNRTENSSDIEFEAAPININKQAAYRGQASIDQLIQDAQSDRLTLEQTVVQLQFGHGAPHTQPFRMRSLAESTPVGSNPANTPRHIILGRTANDQWINGTTSYTAPQKQINVVSQTSGASWRSR